MSISVNARAGALVAQLEARAEELRIEVAKGELGETLIDAGAHCVGGVSAGLRLAEICMGGLGDVALLPDAATPRWPWSIAVQFVEPGDSVPGEPICGLAALARRGPGRVFRAGLGSGARVGAQGGAVRRSLLCRRGD